MRNIMIKYAVLTFCLVSILGHTAYAGSSLTLGSQSGSPMDTITVPVTLESDDQLSALSVDIAYNPRELEFISVEIGPAASSKNLVSNILNNGLVRIGFISFDQMELDSGVVAFLTFSLNPEVEAQKIQVGLKASASNPDGKPVKINSHSGIVIVQ